MQCHKCPHHDAIERGDYFSIPWEETPCAECKLGEDTFYSIPFDEELPPESAAGFQPALSSYTERTAGVSPATCGADFPVCDPVRLSSDLSPLPSGDLLPADLMAQFIQGLLVLDPDLRDIVAWRYQGVPYKEIARRQGTSTQLAEMRHKRAIRDWPALKALFPEKIAKQSRRKRSTRPF